VMAITHGSCRFGQHPVVWAYPGDLPHPQHPPVARTKEPQTERAVSPEKASLDYSGLFLSGQLRSYAQADLPALAWPERLRPLHQHNIVAKVCGLEPTSAANHCSRNCARISRWVRCLGSCLANEKPRPGETGALRSEGSGGRGDAFRPTKLLSTNTDQTMEATTVATAMQVVNAKPRAKITAIFFMIVSPFPRQIASQH
jgi:hypothetical protein